MMKILKDNQAVLTATVEAWGAHDSPENVAHNALLAQHLRHEGYKFAECTGTYQNVDQGPSFLVDGITLEQALEIAAAYRQESIVTADGLFYTDGRRVPATAVLVGPDAAATGDYTTLPNGQVFSLELDWTAL
jgi:hypothetical protein